MEIILTKYCRSLTGTLSRSHGYCIRRVRDRFYSKRNTNAHVPPDGHWRFILCLAHMSGSLHVADICISGFELTDALLEAGLPLPTPLGIPPREYNARDILNLEQQINNM